MPTGIHIGTVALQIADMERSLLFYQSVVGFRLIAQDHTTNGHVAYLGVNGSDRILLELHEKPGVHPVPHRGRIGIYHFAVLLPTRNDLGSFFRHLATLDVQVGAAEHRISEALYLVDPDGITVEVYRDRPRQEWPMRNGEIVAPSLPLDVNGLLQAADEEAWSGLPPGTTIGHMHFYVGDIPRAEAFYHAALGFDKTIWSMPNMLFVAADGYHHHVGLNTWASGTAVATENDAKLLFWDLVFPDHVAVHAAVTNLRNAGCDVVASDAASYIARDPWNIAVRLVTDSADQAH
jgi:catechol 2,3-dioxygenase